MTEHKTTHHKTHRGVAKVARHAIKKASVKHVPAQKKTRSMTKWRMALLYLGWVLVSFVFAEVAVNVFFYILIQLHVPLAIVSESVLQFVASLMVYIVALLTAIYGAARLFKSKTSLKEVGLAQTLPRWRDLGLAPLVFIGYLLLSIVVVQIVTYVFPHLIDPAQKQAIGFTNVVQRYELLAAYVTLTILAPFCEELLFRGFLFGKIRNYLSAKPTIILTGILFGSLHLIGLTATGIQLQWAVMIDTLTLGIVLASLREYTGSIWTGVLVHAIKNSIAFFVLFVAPLLNMNVTDYMQ